MPGEIFQHLTDIYEAMIDWPKRLSGEEPFYRRWFAEAGVKNVLDAACGTGRHAAMFHSWGLRVEGADLSPNMIDRARAAFGQSDGLRWTVRGFDEPAGPPDSFDAALCVGNSLALAPDAATARRALGRMFEAVRPGGLVVVQVLNFWRLEDGPCLWQKCLRTTLPQGDALLLKGVRRSGSRGFVDLVVMRPEGGPPVFSESVPL
ncbi:MAG: class I SAM-dependent methyltransferase, partial [Thermoguttaceae bacterium]